MNEKENEIERGATPELAEHETQFEEFAEKLWFQGLLYKTYTGAVELARKEGYDVKTMPLSKYEIHEDSPHDDYRIELYSQGPDTKHLMTLIFRQAKSKKSKIPFRLKDFHLYKIE